MVLAMPCMHHPALAAIDAMHESRSCSLKLVRNRPPAGHVDGSSTQAQLLCTRGDLKNRKTCFDVNLDEPSLRRGAGSREAFARLGARVVTPSPDMLGMLKVDKVIDRVGQLASPVAKW